MKQNILPAITTYNCLHGVLYGNLSFIDLAAFAQAAPGKGKGETVIGKR